MSTKKVRTEKASKPKKDEPNVGKLVVTKEKPQTLFQSHEWYIAKFKQADIGQGNFGPYVKFLFGATEGVLEDGETEIEGEKLASILVNYDMSIGSKMYTMVASVIGRDPDIDEEIDLRPYYGNPYLIMLENKKDKKSDVVRSNIIKVKIAPGSTKKKTK